MKKKRQHFIEEQNVRVEEHSNESTPDSGSPYSRYMDRSNGHEPAQANPDILADTTENHLWGEGNKPELAQLIIERFADDKGYFPILSRKQNDVLRLYLLGMGVNDIAKDLKMKHQSVTVYLNRIQRRFQRLLKAVDL